MRRKSQRKLKIINSKIIYDYMNHIVMYVGYVTYLMIIRRSYAYIVIVIFI
jgi:hypothetical protein